jgi:hypothetical protein
MGFGYYYCVIKTDNFKEVMWGGLSSLSSEKIKNNGRLESLPHVMFL